MEGGQVVVVQNLLVTTQQVEKVTAFAGGNLPEWSSCFQVWLELALKALDTGVLSDRA